MSQIKILDYLYPLKLNHEQLTQVINSYDCKVVQCEFEDIVIYKFTFDTNEWFLVKSNFTDEGYIVDYDILEDKLSNKRKLHKTQNYLYELTKYFSNNDINKKSKEYFLNILGKEIIYENIDSSTLSVISMELKKRLLEVLGNPIKLNEFKLFYYYLIGEVLKYRVSGTWTLNFDSDFFVRPYVIKDMLRYNYIIWIKDLEDGKARLDIGAIVKISLDLHRITEIKE